jgi:hypothetical protein
MLQMTLGSKELIDAIECGVREIARRHEGEHPKDGCFDILFQVLENTSGIPERLAAIGFPEVTRDQLAFILQKLEEDGTCGDYLTDRDELLRLAGPITAWHDNNLWAKNSQAAGKHAMAS